MKKIAINAALVFFSVIIGCSVLWIVGELYFQIKFHSIHGDSNIYTTFHESRGWQLKPGKYSVYEPRIGQAVEISINGAGLRGSEITAQPDQGKRRISFIGDSFVFSAELGDDKIFTHIVQEKIGDKYEILNISAPGYGTGQQYLFIRDLISRGYDLGRLVLVFYTNDILDNLGLSYTSLKPDTSKPAFEIDESGRLNSTAPQPQTTNSTMGSLLHKSYFLQFVAVTFQDLILSHPILFEMLESMGIEVRLPRVPGVIAGWYSPGWEARWSATRNILKYVVQDLRKRSLAEGLLIVFMPSPFQTEKVFREIVSNRMAEDKSFGHFLSDTDRPQRVLAEFCDELQVPFVDLTSDLRQIQGAHFSRGGHLNEIGASVVARRLVSAVLDLDRTSLHVSASGPAGLSSSRSHE